MADLEQLMSELYPNGVKSSVELAPSGMAPSSLQQFSTPGGNGHKVLPYSSTRNPEVSGNTEKNETVATSKYVPQATAGSSVYISSSKSFAPKLSPGSVTTLDGGSPEQRNQGHIVTLLKLRVSELEDENEKLKMELQELKKRLPPEKPRAAW